MLNKYYLAPFSILLLPVLAKAFSLRESTIGGVIIEATGIVNLVIPILFSIAFLVFFWGLSKFILNSGSETEISKGKKYMVWGVLALFILFSYSAIVSFVSIDLGIGEGDPNSVFLPERR